MQPAVQTRRRRRWRRLAAVAFGLGLVGVVELACVLFGWGKPELAEDPFIGFSAVHPLFTRNPVSGLMETAPSRRKHFCAESFALPKPRGTFRAFCLGGSTVQGNPYSKETAFTTWLELSLEAAAPDRRWEIVNCGGISYASYRLANILRECLACEPDLFILCTGHNEFLEDRTYAGIKHAPRLVRAPLEAASRLRTFTLMRQAWLNMTRASAPTAARSRTILNDEVDPWLDYEGGLKVYHRDEAWRAGVIAHYELNLRRMIAMARDAGVPVILVKPTSNLRDCPPFKSQHRDGLSEPELQQWEALVHEAASLKDTNPHRKLELLREAAAIDDQFAATFYQLGRCHDALGETAPAREAYLRARELDVCPLRILAPMEEALARVAEETDTPLIDAQALIEARSRDGIPGDDWLLDHIHPSIEGHQLIAGALLEEMVRQHWLQPTDGWEGRREAAFARNWSSLPADYYKEGERHLAGLRAWTQGRASGPSIDYRMFSRAREGR